MSYGIQVRDAESDIIYDSDFPAFAFEKKVSLTHSSTFNDLTWAAHDPSNPGATATASIRNGTVYVYSTTSVFQGDTEASKSMLAVMVPNGGFCFYDKPSNTVMTTYTGLQVAVMKPATSLAMPNNFYGIAAYDANGVLTYSSAWPLARFQSPLKTGTIIETSWFLLSGARRRRPVSAGGTSAWGNVGVRRNTLTSMTCIFGPFNYGTVSAFGADSQEAPGMVLYNIEI